MDADDLIDCQYQDYLSAKEFEDEEMRRNLNKYGTFTYEINKQVPLAADLCQCDTSALLHKGEGQYIGDGAAQQSSDRSAQA
jgi:hypothetical protein